MIKLYNTLSRKKEVFESLNKNIVKMYSCGPTVYDYAHIGNLSTYLFADLLKRYLQYSGYEIIDVMNITDVDDKTIKGSQKEHTTLEEYTNFYTESLFADFNMLNILKPKKICKATDYIDEMIVLIQDLIDKGYAYRANDGSVYFEISKFKNYGKLSNLKKRMLKEGASGRIELDEYEKDNASDFVLWKAWQKKDGDNFWQSSFGRGRPGWHIECSAMSMKNLGNTFDIHTGAVDLIFPHHENEIAQSEASTGQKFVKYWLHREHLKIDGKKMSKSLKNFYVLNDVLKEVSNPMAFRYLILTSNYRENLNFTFEGLRSADRSLGRIQNFIIRTKEQIGRDNNHSIDHLIENTRQKIIKAMNDDLNTALAISNVHEFITEVNKIMDTNQVSDKNVIDIISFFKDWDSIFGFLLFNEQSIPDEKKEEIEQKIQKRNKYRVKKNWSEADKVKEELFQMGITLKDNKDGTTWYVQ
ncbi:MAG: cysteine--tRNA ligase [Candidatus Moraniibacteriota bacterium]|jgi:cysteinyl-tRNA synthetase